MILKLLIFEYTDVAITIQENYWKHFPCKEAKKKKKKKQAKLTQWSLKKVIIKTEISKIENTC